MSSFREQIWTTIASGGHWSSEEVKRALPMVRAKAIDEALWQMAQGGYVTRLGDGRFGITHDCKVPNGLSVGEVLQATGVA